MTCTYWTLSEKQSTGRLYSWSPACILLKPSNCNVRKDLCIESHSLLSDLTWPWTKDLGGLCIILNECSFESVQRSVTETIYIQFLFYMLVRIPLSIVRFPWGCISDLTTINIPLLPSGLQWCHFLNSILKGLERENSVMCMQHSGWALPCLKGVWQCSSVGH